MRHLHRFLILLFCASSLLVLSPPSIAVIQDTEPFDWTMPPRLLENPALVGHDPPIPMYDPAALMLPPEGWRVDLDACGVSTSTITSYEWSVDGVPVGAVTDCIFPHHFPALGTYQVTLRLTDDVGDTAVLDQTVTVQDWLVIAVGDSYGSGEGNPEKPVSAQVNIDLSILFNLTQDILADLQAAVEELPGLEEASAAAQQLRDDALVTRDQAAQDLAELQGLLQQFLVVQNNVESDPVVTAARNYVIEVQQWVNEARAARNAAQSDYDNCSFGNCAFRLTILAAAETELLAAETELLAAQAALFLARNTAVVVYSAAASIQNFDTIDAFNAALSARQAAVNTAQNAFNLAQNAYQNAQEAFQQAVAAVSSLHGIITDLEGALDDARQEAVAQYLDSLPVWLETPPSWGTPEPTYREIVLDGAVPGEALRCHRSMISGQARAALMLEQADPRTSVTLVHLSCSGATIDSGLIGEYEGQPVDSVLSALASPLVAPAAPALVSLLPDMQEQIIAAVERTQGREVDALVVSIGGNDIRFSGLIEECILGEPCHIDEGLPPVSGFNDALVEAIEANCRPVAIINQLTGLSLPTSNFFPFSDRCLEVYDLAQRNIEAGAALQTFNDHMFGNEGAGVTSLATKFHELNEYLAAEFAAFDQRRLYITEYPDPTADDLGNYCGWDPSQPPMGDGLRYLPGVSVQENTWAHLTVASALRDQTETAAALHQWNFVSEFGDNGQTIASATRNHGYCAENNWSVTLPESLINQQDYYGAVHPDSNGQGVYAQAIFSHLVADLYPAGVEQAPRAPVSAIDDGPAGDGGGSSGGSGAIGWGTLILLAGFWWMRRRFMLTGIAALAIALASAAHAGVKSETIDHEVDGKPIPVTWSTTIPYGDVIFNCSAGSLANDTEE